jgi:hypothetical protein
MTEREAIQALIEQAYEARKTGNVERIIDLFHPDGKFELAGSKEFEGARWLVTAAEIAIPAPSSRYVQPSAEVDSVSPLLGSAHAHIPGSQNTLLPRVSAGGFEDPF